MKLKAICKIVVDIVMIGLMLLAMACRLTGVEFHEFIGISLFIFFIIHNILNLNWYKSLLKGKYNAIRVFHTTINVFLIVSMLGVLISGIMQSRWIFTFLNIQSGMFAQQLHMMSSYWGFIFMSVHLGLHWHMLMGSARKMTKLTISSHSQTFILRMIAILISVYGVYAFLSREVALKLIAYYLYDFWDPNQPVVLFFIDYLSIIGLFACLAYYIRKLIQYCSVKKIMLRKEII